MDDFSDLDELTETSSDTSDILAWTKDFLSDKYSDTEATIASKMMFNMAGVTFRPYQPGNREIHLNL